ncbi:MAG TPA: UvrD-helicase domain-containing protein, partial [Phycisphaerae bacterium]|nr:UvrD-helicase domain-containing protein [Phycisphaerae bacterium]
MEHDGGERAVSGGREWTEFQRAAIAHGAGELLVSAAAGSGKTAVLAERCARLVCEGREAGVGIENLLVLTFTEAAATEMKGRIGGAIEGKLRAVEEGGGGAEEMRWLRRQVRGLDRASISTLHGFCARVLRQHFAAAGIDPAFEVMDGDEARLLREEVAGEVIGRWHKRVPGGVGEEDFAGFYEAYAQGSDGSLAEMVLRLREMLASVAEPAAYVAAARRVYGEGVGEVMERWAKEIVAQQVRVEGLRARRAAAEVLRRVGPGAMAEGLGRAAEMLAWAEGELRGKGCAAMGAVREALSYKWPQCKTVKEVADFEGLKRRTWGKVKEGMAGLCEKALAADVGEMGREMGKLGPMLEVLLGLVA